MDTSRLSQGQMIAGVGGIVLIVSLFLDWGFGISAFDAFSAMDLIMLVVGIVAIAYAVLPATGSATRLPPMSASVLLLLSVAVAGFALGNALEDPAAGIGAWLALIASIAIAYGAWSDVSGLGARRFGRGQSTVTTSPPGPSGP